MAVGLFEIIFEVALGTYDLVMDILYLATTEFYSPVIKGFCIVFLVLNPYFQLGYVIQRFIENKKNQAQVHDENGRPRPPDNGCTVLLHLIFPCSSINRLVRARLSLQDALWIVISPIVGELHLVQYLSTSLGIEQAQIRTETFLIEFIFQSIPQFILQVINNEMSGNWGVIPVLSIIGGTISILYTLVRGVLDYIRQRELCQSLFRRLLGMLTALNTKERILLGLSLALAFVKLRYNDYR